MYSCIDNYIYLIIIIDVNIVVKDILFWCSFSVIVWLLVIDKRISLGLWVRNFNVIFIFRLIEYLLVV